MTNKMCPWLVQQRLLTVLKSKATLLETTSGEKKDDFLEHALGAIHVKVCGSSWKLYI